MRTTKETKILFEERLIHITGQFLVITNIKTAYKKELSYNEPGYGECTTWNVDVFLKFKNTTNRESELCIKLIVCDSDNQNTIDTKINCLAHKFIDSLLKTQE